MDKQIEEIIVEVSREEYEADLARGLNTDEVLPAGRHLFRRGGFGARHGIAPDKIDVTIEVEATVELEPDILRYFQEQAALPDAEPLQTQVNNVLRDYMEADRILTHG